MTETEKAYIAGIIDGEGSIMLIRAHPKEFPSPCISIASTTMELLRWVKDTVGSGTITHKKNYNPEVHKECYSYVLKFDAAINLMRDIYPYLIIKVKKKRAKLIIDKYKSVTPRNGRYSNEMLELKEKFYEEFMQIK